MTKIEASGLVGALERAWAAIQERHEDVPDVVVTLGAGSLGAAPGTLKLGHFAASRWSGAAEDGEAVAELFVGGEGLVRGAEGTLSTLLHEAAHGMAETRGIQDTSRQGRYHNKKFRDLGEEVGLTITQEKSIGWSGTALPEQTRDAYAAELAELGAALTAWRRSEGMAFVTGGGQEDDGESDGDTGDEDQDEKKPKNGYPLVCGCETPRRIRVAATVAELGPITCGLCDQEFTTPPESD